MTSTKTGQSQTTAFLSMRRSGEKIRIETGDPTSNLAWGDDGSTLYITAGAAIYRLKLSTKGPGFYLNPKIISADEATPPSVNPASSPSRGGERRKVRVGP